MYKLTITDLETGKTEVDYEAKIIMGACKIEDMTMGICVGKGSPADAVECMMAVDEVRERAMNDYPLTRLAWMMRDEIFKKAGIIDISELKRQMGGIS